MSRNGFAQVLITLGYVYFADARGKSRATQESYPAFGIERLAVCLFLLLMRPERASEYMGAVRSAERAGDGRRKVGSGGGVSEELPAPLAPPARVVIAADRSITKDVPVTPPI